MFELWNTFDVFVSIVEVMITGVAQALVPEKPLSRSTNSSHGGILLDVFMEWEVMELGRQGFELRAELSALGFLVGVDTVEESTLAVGSKVRIGGKGRSGRRGRCSMR